jgi:transcriptional regulator GlxA family with amidase domain
MKSLTILVPAGQNNLSSIIGSYKVFTRANELWKQKGKKGGLEVRLAGLSKNVLFHDGIFSVKPHLHIDQIKKTDLIIIPAVNKDFDSSIKLNKKLIGWLKSQYDQGAEIASICTGAFLLASSGLLEGKTCSTHWAAADRFKELFPDVKLATDQLITDENRLYTNGGAFSFLNLVLYLVEKYYDRQTAIVCSKVFQIDIDRHSQSPFTIFQGQKNHGDELIQKAQEIIEKKLDERISMEYLSSKLAISRRSFDRRFIKATGNTPIEYLQRVKIEAAKKFLETSGKTINEIMYQVGYSDMKAFREVFKKVTGMSPLEYKNRYNKMAMV